jgi:hypothetical protein
MDHKALERMGTNWPPKTQKPFVDKGFSMGTHSASVGTVGTSGGFRYRETSFFELNPPLFNK